MCLYDFGYVNEFKSVRNDFLKNSNFLNCNPQYSNKVALYNYVEFILRMNPSCKISCILAFDLKPCKNWVILGC